MNIGLVTEQFRDAIQSAGLIPPDVIEPDGKLHRFASNGKSGDDAGWYALHGDGIPAGSFGDWRSGISETWRAEVERKLTPAEQAAHRARIEAMRREREAEDARRHAEAASKAAAIWQAAQPATADHAYLIRKSIKAHGARLHDDKLVIPMRDAAGDLRSIQFIGPDGEKRFLLGGRVTGCYFGIGKPDGVLCIAEGYATGASIHEATGYAVAVAFNAGNLEPTARALRAKFPDIRLILCADDDAKTPGNPGITKATEAARSVGGLVAIPDFGTDRPEVASDFNDMRQHCGAEAVARAVASATAPEKAKPDRADFATVELVRGSSVKPEPVEWLWPDYLAAGKPHILGGAPGTGKTTLAMALAATVTIGGRWPDGSRTAVGCVVIWSGEDDPADTLIPRLMLCGADLSRVYFVTAVREGNERRPFDPARDMEALRCALVEIQDVRLLVVDPIVSAVAGDSHKNAEVRRALQPLSDLAAHMRCALLGITHFSKGTSGRDPVERITGSLAFGALARVVLVAAKVQEETEGGNVRLFLRAKSNIGPDDGGFEYELLQAEVNNHPGVFATCVQWGGAVQGAARELLATADATGEDGEGGTIGDAKQFLADLLADGPMPTKAIKADADGAGYAWRTIRRAQKALGVEAFKEGMRAGWSWRLPAKVAKYPEYVQQNNVDTFGKSGHLRQSAAGSGAVEVEI